MSTWLIFGTSPFIKNINNWAFTEKYLGHRIAVNHFNKCTVDYRVANDSSTMEAILKYNYSGKCVFHKGNYLKLADELDNPNQEMIDTLYDWSPDLTLEPNKLCCRHTSFIAALGYAIKNGATEIILIGIDLTWENGHGNISNPFLRLWDMIRRKPKEVWKLCEIVSLVAKATKFARIMRLNPESELPLSWLPHINMEEL